MNSLPGDSALGERQAALVLSDAGNPLTEARTGIFAAGSDAQVVGVSATIKPRPRRLTLAGRVMPVDGQLPTITTGISESGRGAKRLRQPFRGPSKP